MAQRQRRPRPRPARPHPLIDFRDDFRTTHLSPSWQWPVNTRPEIDTGHNRLKLRIPLASPLAATPAESALIAVPRPASLHYQATVAIVPALTPTQALWAGLSVIGDPFNTIGLGLRGTDLILWERRGATQRIIAQTPIPPTQRILLRSASIGTEHTLQFSYSTDEIQFHTLGEPYNASDLPAWDRGLRIGLMLEGPLGATALFQNFELKAQP